MHGFDDRALILLPKYDVYMEKSPTYKNTLRTSVENIIKYLGTQGIAPYGLYTDDIMREYSPKGVNMLIPLTRADAFWAAHHCDGMSDALGIEPWTDDPEAIRKATQDADKAKDLNEILEKLSSALQ